MSHLEVSKSSVTNSKAVASLVLGILSIIIPLIGFILGIIGIVLSRIAIKEIIRINENGRALATSGLICSIVGIVLQMFGIIGLFSFMMVTTEIQQTASQLLPISQGH